MCFTDTDKEIQIAQPIFGNKKPVNPNYRDEDEIITK